ncbi:CD225/dispanin family protein [Streptomyces sp. NPDC049577]|uniref:CD225/dispanin family protein n=1 Tax=Streptomyces sp. NPDC049577 TaxID=3155153 RepID=UPI00342AA564
MSQEPWPGRPPPEDRPRADNPPPRGDEPGRPASPPPQGYPPQPGPQGWPGAGHGGYPPPPQGAAPYGRHPPQSTGPPPPSHLAWAIISIFLFWPLGIPAVVFAAQVNGKYAAGDYTGAHDSSGKARLFSLIATIIGVIGIIVAIVFGVLLADWAFTNIPDNRY